MMCSAMASSQVASRLTFALSSSSSAARATRRQAVLLAPRATATGTDEALNSEEAGYKKRAEESKAAGVSDEMRGPRGGDPPPQVGPGRHCPPRHPPRFGPSFLECAGDAVSGQGGACGERVASITRDVAPHYPLGPARGAGGGSGP